MEVLDVFYVNICYVTILNALKKNIITFTVLDEDFTIFVWMIGVIVMFKFFFKASCKTKAHIFLNCVILFAQISFFAIFLWR